jgi:hypothetical protein
MAVNRDKPDRWKADLALSVDMYNTWFIDFAPQAFRATRIEVTQDVASSLKATDNLKNLHSAILRSNPEILPTLRMCTCPLLPEIDSLGYLVSRRVSSITSGRLRQRMEIYGKLPVRPTIDRLNEELEKIASIISRLADRDILPWLDTNQSPTETEIYRASTIIADRLCGASADPIVRNAQEGVICINPPKGGLVRNRV